MFLLHPVFEIKDKTFEINIIALTILHFIKTCAKVTTALHRSAFCQFPFRWIYYCHSIKSTGKETGKMYLCALLHNSFSVTTWTSRLKLTEMTSWGHLVKIRGYNLENVLQLTIGDAFAGASIAPIICHFDSSSRLVSTLNFCFQLECY